MLQAEKENKKLSCGSFFSGVGGIDLAFQNTGFNIVYANEIDLYPVETYNLNFDVKADNRDIHDVHGDEIPNFSVMIGGFPCQAFSVAGYQRGFDDEKGRGTLFFEMVRIIKEKKAIGHQPSIVFFENVKNLKRHDKGNTFSVIMEQLHLLGYKTNHRILNACKFGNIPQNRERVYIIGFLDADKPNIFDAPQPIPLTRTIADIADFHEKVDDKYYYTPQKNHFYATLEKAITRSNTVYQWRRTYVRENKSNMCPTLTANMGGGETMFH